MLTLNGSADGDASGTKALQLAILQWNDDFSNDFGADPRLFYEAEIQSARNEEPDGNHKRVLSTLENVSLCTF